MKKFYILSLLLSFFIGMSQETTTQDALRYATENLTGTARFRAMSGAFGSLGGDLSAINVNPAGSAIFNHNMASITASSFNTKNKSSYFGSSTSENYSILDLNQLGAVFVFIDTNNDWKKFSIAVNYENTNNFDDRLFSAGTNPNNSVSNYFLNFAQGLPLEFMQLQNNETIPNLYSYLGETGGLGFPAQQAFLGFQAYLFDPVDGNDLGNVNYTSNIPFPARYYQENSITSTGYNGKLTGNFATSYKDKLYLGLSLNAHFTDYVRNSSVYESNNDISSPNRLNSLRFNNELYTYGSGFSFNLGAIFQATEELRVGLAYESPTWLRLNDELRQSLVGISYENGVPVSTGADIVSPNITNIYPTYHLQTAQKFTGSASYVFNKKGLISIDASMKDYTNTKFSPSNDPAYVDVNSSMSANLKNALELRIGGEYRIKQFSLRAGYRFEESPFKVDYAMGDLTGYSGGIGFNFGESKLDLAYSNSHRNYNQSFVSSGMNDTSRIRTIQNNVTLTYSINF
ncbi:transporter [Flavobacterium jejuense]|uniref:Transporter n=1 Tax=Flavobacterium jejuense TaxID=1544455 RepID=A0ABX0IXA0_9FLAO|nr:outer membrane protein transport protein [Flavobacterium jejuense]NHN27796.1 transporter [Flavobacterium jejuense]